MMRHITRFFSVVALAAAFALPAAFVFTGDVSAADEAPAVLDSADPADLVCEAPAPEVAPAPAADCCDKGQCSGGCDSCGQTIYLACCLDEDGGCYPCQPYECNCPAECE